MHTAGFHGVSIDQCLHALSEIAIRDIAGDQEATRGPVIVLRCFFK